jgi:hypothetical protein
MTQTTVMPKPRMALQVGITGHRSNKLEPENLPAIEHTLRSIYEVIDKAAFQIVLETEDKIYTKGAPGMPNAPAAPSAPAPGTIGGEWSGKYFCAQAVTGTQLIFSGDGLRALFHFYAVPENPGVPEGCFTMAGFFDPNSSMLNLTAGQWLVRPRNFCTANVSGLVDAGRQNFLGRLLGPPGCTVIALTREPSPRPLPNACERGLP